MKIYTPMKPVHSGGVNELHTVRVDRPLKQEIKVGVSSPQEKLHDGIVIISDENITVFINNPSFNASGVTPILSHESLGNYYLFPSIKKTFNSQVGLKVDGTFCEIIPLHIIYLVEVGVKVDGTFCEIIPLHIHFLQGGQKGQGTFCEIIQLHIIHFLQVGQKGQGTFCEIIQLHIHFLQVGQKGQGTFCEIIQLHINFLQVGQKGQGTFCEIIPAPYSFSSGRTKRTGNIL